MPLGMDVLCITSKQKAPYTDGASFHAAGLLLHMRKTPAKMHHKL